MLHDAHVRALVHLFFLSLLALATTPLLLACGADTKSRPEQASSRTIRDGRGDLWPREFTGTSKPTAKSRNGDAIGAAVRRTARALVVRVHYDAIKPHANKSWGVDFELRIPRDSLSREATWTEYQYADTHRWARETSYVRSSSEDSLGERCRGLTAHPDFHADTVTVRVPERCFDHSHSVTVKGLNAFSDSPSGDDLVDYVGTDGPNPPRSVWVVKPS